MPKKIQTCRPILRIENPPILLEIVRWTLGRLVVFGSLNKKILYFSWGTRHEAVWHLFLRNMLDLKPSGTKLFPQVGQINKDVYKAAYPRIFAIFNKNFVEDGKFGPNKKTYCIVAVRHRQSDWPCKINEKEKVFNLIAIINYACFNCD